MSIFLASLYSKIFKVENFVGCKVRTPFWRSFMIGLVMYNLYCVKFWWVNLWWIPACLLSLCMYVTRHCYNSDGKIWQTTSGSPNLPGFSSSAKNSRYTVHWKAFADVKKWETTEVFPPPMFCSVYPYERKWWSLSLTMGIKIKKYWTRTVLFTLLHTLWSNNKSTWWSNDLK